MITDFILNIFLSLFNMFVGALPSMPERPFSDSDLNKLWTFLGNANYWLPVYEIVQSFVWISAGFAIFIIWRIIRVFTPGG